MVCQIYFHLVKGEGIGTPKLHNLGYVAGCPVSFAVTLQC